MNKELKNKVDSIRRTLKNQGVDATGAEIESKILELFPNYPDDWCSDARSEVIKAITKDNQPAEIISSISETSIHVGGEMFPNSPTIMEEQETSVNEIEADKESNQLVISESDKQALVTAQSTALGLNLTEEETEAIAESIDDVFEDYSIFVNTVTNAIKGYITHKFDSIENDLDSSSNDVREYLTNRANRLNQKVADYASNVAAIKADTEAIRQSLKSSQGAILSRFRVK